MTPYFAFSAVTTNSPYFPPTVARIVALSPSAAEAETVTLPVAGSMVIDALPLTLLHTTEPVAVWLEGLTTATRVVLLPGAMVILDGITVTPSTGMSFLATVIVQTFLLIEVPSSFTLYP